jgi:hypothetical protein
MGESFMEDAMSNGKKARRERQKVRRNLRRDLRTSWMVYLRMSGYDDLDLELVRLAGNHADAQRIYDMLLKQGPKKIDLISGYGGKPDGWSLPMWEIEKLRQQQASIAMRQAVDGMAMKSLKSLLTEK